MTRPDRRPPLTVLLLLALTTATAMASQDDGSVDAAPEPLPLVDQTTVVADGDLFVLSVGPSALDTTDLTVAVELFPAVDATNTSFQPGDDAPIVSAEEVTASEVLVSGAGAVTVRVPVGGAGGGQLVAPGPGVYPLRLTLTDGDGASGRVSTTLVVAASTPDAAGSSTVGIVMEVGADAIGVAEATALLAARPTLVATVILRRDAVELLEENAGLLTAFGAALGQRPLVVGTAAPLDPSALVGAGRADGYRGSHLAMQRRVAALSLPVDPAATIVETPLTLDGSRLLGELGVRTAIAPVGGAPVGAERWPVATGFVQPDPGQGLFVVGTDAERFASIASSAADDAHQAHELLASIVLDRSTAPDRPHAVVVGGLHRFSDPGSVLDVLTAEASDAVLDRASVTDVGFQAMAGTGGAVALRESPAVDLSAVGDQLARVEALLVRYEAFHADGSAPPAEYRERLLDALRSDLDPAARSAALDGVAAELTAAFEAISLPGNQTVTLAARSAPLPVAVENRADGARRVLVRLTSDEIALDETDLIVTVPPGTGAVDLPVRTRSLGASPVTITFLSPDGAQVLSTTRFQVRSTAVPGLGLALSAVGVAGLALWWSVSVRRERRADRSQDDDGQQGSHGAGPDHIDGGSSIDLRRRYQETRAGAPPGTVDAGGSV